MNVIEKIYYKLFPGTIYDQEKRYLEEFGYPNKSIYFCDSQGRMSQIIGKETFIKNIQIFNKIFKK